MSGHVVGVKGICEMSGGSAALPRSAPEQARLHEPPGSQAGACQHQENCSVLCLLSNTGRIACSFIENKQVYAWGVIRCAACASSWLPPVAAGAAAAMACYRPDPSCSARRVMQAFFQ